MKSALKLFVLCVLAISVNAQEKSKWPKVDASPLEAVMYPQEAAWRNYLPDDKRNIKPDIKVMYSRPQMKGRTIFGDEGSGALVPYGKEWRLGANEATTVTFYKDVNFGNTAVPRGVYTMFATPSNMSWTVTLSKQQGIWGGENRDKSMDVASATASVKRTDEALEAMGITFQKVDEMSVNMVIQWDKTRAMVPISFNPVFFDNLQKSPMDMAHYPSKSAYTNYLEGDEKNLKPKVQVQYGRPYKKDRNVFGDLLKVGDIWRVGANQSTEIVFYEDVKVGDVDLKAGRYALFAELKQGSWDMIFSKDYPTWGNANRDEEMDVARVNIQVTTESEVVENLSIIFEEKNDKLVHMVIGWDKTRAAMPITFK